MKIYINKGIGITEIDVDNTQWCCDKLKNAPTHRPIYDDDMYIGDQPDYIFNWDKYEFQKVNDGMMFGNGGFGDRFWGERIDVCPFCGTSLKRNTFYINGIKTRKRDICK
jgi:hypothetical protein